MEDFIRTRGYAVEAADAEKLQEAAAGDRDICRRGRRRIALKSWRMLSLCICLNLRNSGIL